MTMFVQPIGGLCNRLRVIISYLLVARSRQERLIVYWMPHEACPALFRDLFERTATSDLLIKEPALGPRDTTTVTCYRHPEAPPESEWLPTVMEVLVPLPALQVRIDELLAALGPDFTALHIRRTDHNSNYDKDADYVTFCGGEGKVFAATDNIQSMVTLKKGLGDRLVYGGKFAKAGIRMTAVSDAVVDLWTCARAARFKGTYYSSFSDWIEMMRVGMGSGSAGDLSA
jgi:hypothetical protein